MSITKIITENSLLQMLSSSFKRAPNQINKFNESDAELINLPGTDFVLALTTDNISEEIKSGLYDDAYQIGRMCVLVNISDLAAVGAEPFGILLNQTFAYGTNEEYMKSLQKGINDVCNETGICVLGGDTNFSLSPSFGACAIGIIRGNKIIQRTGAKPGDILFATGKLGAGNAYAFAKLVLKDKSLINYDPKPRIKEGQIIRQYGSCCMDTSDGTVAVLDQLMRLNSTGFKIESNYNDYLDKQAYELLIKKNLPPPLILSGIHGEFELIFTVPQDKIEEFTKAASVINWKPVKLGKTAVNASIKINNGLKMYEIDSARIRNAYEASEGNINNYLNELINNILN